MLQGKKHDDMNKSEHTKKKTPIVLLGLLAIAIAAVTIAWGISKGRTDDLPANRNVSSGQEEDDGLVVEGKATASDEATLRKLLLKDEEITIDVADDIEIQEELVVNGKKTLKGNIKLTMWLAAVDEQAVLSVPENASLTIEGVSLDGNSISDGVRVEAGGELTYKSGTMEYTAEYGVRCSGIATLEELYIENAMFCGVYAENGGKVYLNDCSMKDAKQNFVHVANGGYAEVNGKGTYENCLARSFSNEGTLVVNGESSTNDEEQPIKLINTYFGFLNQGEGELSITGVSIDSSDRSAVYSNGGIVNIKNSFFKNQTNAALQVGEEAEMNLENVAIKDCANAGVYASDKTKVTINGLDIDGCRRGVNSCGGKIIGQNVTVKEPVVFGAASYSEKGNRGYVELKNLKVIKAGNAGLYAYEGDLKVTNGEITNSEKYGVDTVAGAVVTLKNVNVKNSADHNYWIGKKSECTVSGKSVVSNGKIRNIYVDGILTMSSSTICDVKNNADGAGVYVDERGTFNMNGGTVKNNHTGKVGGGIFLKGTANVNSVVFENNSASGAGGAIRVRSGVLNVDKCTFMNNSATASSGGGITVEGAKVSVKNSEFSKNTASNDGGALHIANTKASVSVNSCKFTENIASGNKYSAGGAIIATMGNCDVVNSSFSKNSADYLGGAVENREGAFTATNCTFEENKASKGGAVSQNGKGSATLKADSEASGVMNGNSAIVKSDSVGGALYQNKGKLTVEGYNISDNEAKSAGGAVYIMNGATIIHDSKVQDNVSGSAGAGVRLVAGELTIDNSTFARNQSPSNSGGAITVEGAKATISNTTFTENTAKLDGGALHIANEAADVTLDSCIFSKNSVSSNDYSAGGAIIATMGNCKAVNTKFVENSATYLGGAVENRSGAFQGINCTFENNTAKNGGAISQNGSGSAILTVEAGKSGKLQKNAATGFGGAVYTNNQGIVTVDGYSVFENKSDSAGGAFYINNSKVTINNSGVQDNISDRAGAAIRLVTGELAVDNTTFAGNQSVSSSGGAITVEGAKATINNTVFDKNQAKESGGALHIVNEAADVTLEACTLSENTSSGAGGALYIDNGKVTINQSGVQKNTSGSAGAGVRLVKGKLTVDGSRFEGNSSPTSSGGAITIQGAEASISNTDFVENTAKGDGGALHLANEAANVTLDSCTFSKNDASGNQYSVGGAIFVDSGKCQATDTEFKENNAGYLGGAINNRIGTFQGINCIFENNTATKGGAVSQNGAGSSTFTVDGENSSKFKGNTATDRAGAVNAQDGTVSISGYTFEDNSANDGTDVYVCYSKKLAISDCSFVNNGEVKLEQGAIADISGNLAGAVFVNKGIAALNVANPLEENADNIISITPSSYAKGTKVLSKGEAVSDAQWEYAYKSIKITPNGDDASWYIDKDGCLQSSAVDYVASIGNTGYANFSEAMTAANTNGGTGETEAVVVTLHANVTINAQVDIKKNIKIQNAEGKDVIMTRAADHTGNLFDINVDNVTFTLGNNEENATGTITVNAASANAIGGRTIYNHKATSTVVLGKNATLTGAKCSSAGAALANLGTAHLYGNMTNNSSTSNGGAINHASTKKLYIYAGNYTNNTATGSGKCGGAIYNDAGGNIIISGGKFSENKAAKGGAIYCMYYATEGYKLTITGGTFEKNEATNNADSGGAVYLQRTRALISGGTFKENVATYRGGAIQCNADGTNKCVLDITGGTFTGNVSKTQGGGAISALNTTANISGATMTGNVCFNKDSSTYMGGGALLIQQNSTVTLSNCTINGNTTVGEGNAATNTGFDIGFRGQSSANLILADETFAGSIGWVFGDTTVNVSIGSNSNPITLTKGIYTVDYTNKELKQAQ